MTGFLISLAIAGAPADGFDRGLPESPDFFPLAVWVQSPSNAEKYAKIGINTYVALWNGPTAEQLDALEKAGMRVICNGSDRAIRQFKDRDLIIAWMHGDEPDNAQSLPDGKGYGPPIPPDQIVESYRRIREADPTRPVLLNLGQGVAWDGWYGRGVRTNHPEDYPKYLEGCDLASFDIYPASHDKPEVAGKLEFVPNGVARLREWTGDAKPVWCCIETTQISNPGHAPTPSQVRAEAWMAIIQGADGLIYFCHQFQPRFIEAGLLADDSMTQAVGELNRQITKLSPVLKSPELPEAERVEASSSNEDVPILAMTRTHGGATYVFAASSANAETTATFRLPGDPKRVEVLDEGREIEIEGGKWVDRFAPYQIHLYRLTTGAGATK